MKLYKITRMADALNADGDFESTRQVAGWTTSEGDASKLCTKYKKADKENEPERESFEVPTTRDELVKFLNAFAAPAFALGLDEMK